MNRDVILKEILKISNQKFTSKSDFLEWMLSKKEELPRPPIELIDDIDHLKTTLNILKNLNF